MALPFDVRCHRDHFEVAVSDQVQKKATGGDIWVIWFALSLIAVVDPSLPAPALLQAAVFPATDRRPRHHRLHHALHSRIARLLGFQLIACNLSVTFGLCIQIRFEKELWN